MELGLECLELWGYIEELIWVKINQLQRIIRTGHWLNHNKEHCLVRIKGNLEVISNIDTDVIVVEFEKQAVQARCDVPYAGENKPKDKKVGVICSDA
ncbi:hypothetical protein AMTR_s00014p00258050 [Amborella trichopoda]|uniref:Uncharacterized protein n=1 Tax=Amborella trichopoda TaxID=13333 RepID=W1PGW1_AMBTC|nr:hypothetical protein AMTR_s00014p00258050 [Amborella trichopoda]